MMEASRPGLGLEDPRGQNKFFGLGLERSGLSLDLERSGLGRPWARGSALASRIGLCLDSNLSIHKPL